jgi:hypothetical protein
MKESKLHDIMDQPRQMKELKLHDIRDQPLQQEDHHRINKIIEDWCD